MANRERVVASAAKDLGNEASIQEVRDVLSLLVETIVAGLRQGYEVALVDREKLSDRATIDITTLVAANKSGNPVSQDTLEEVVWEFLERNIDESSGEETDLAFIKYDTSGEQAELFFPLDEEE